MNKKGIIAIAAGVILLGTAASCITITEQDEYKLIRQFGKISRVISEPGIGIKLPLFTVCRNTSKTDLII